MRWRRTRRWRTLAAIDDDVLERIKTAPAHARAAAWVAGADPGFYVVDIDATLLRAHSDRELAAPTWKRGFGFHPLLAISTRLVVTEHQSTRPRPR